MPKVLLAVSPEWRPRLAQTVLWRSDVERFLATDAASAFDMARTLRPRLILLDGTSAETAAFVRRLRAEATTRSASVAVLVPSPSRAEADELRRAGANAVLSGKDAPAQWDDPFEELLGVPPRREVRVPVVMKVSSRRAQGDGTLVPGTSVNISVNGLLIETREALPAGTMLNLSFELPSLREGKPSALEELRLVGRVVWMAEPTGGATRCGIEFLGFHGNAMDLIAAFVSANRPEEAP